jgi:hypothetical protein
VELGDQGIGLVLVQAAAQGFKSYCLHACKVKDSPGKAQ